jgi:hypothetical protein
LVEQCLFFFLEFLKMLLFNFVVEAFVLHLLPD